MSELRADGVRVACPLFHAGGGGSTPTSALDLRLVRIPFETAKALNRLWHSRFPLLTSPQCRASYAAEFDGLYYAVAIWCRPIAGNRLSIGQYAALELQRFAISPDAPPNAASRLLSVMATVIRREFPEVSVLLSYQDVEVHDGTIYKAAGWLPASVSEYKSWSSDARTRNESQSKAPKRRWEKILRPVPSPPTPVAQDRAEPEFNWGDE